jgi:hypothetical protein
MGHPRRKVSTLLDDALYRRAKLEAVRQGKQVSEILGEALAAYLAERGGRSGAGVVAETWGSIRVDAPSVKQVMEEDDWLGARSR